MTLLPFCQWLAATPGSVALHESLFMYPLVESAHVLTLCVFLGMAIMLDLRLLGLTLRRVPLSEIINRLGPWMVAGFVVMVITGGLLFYAIPVRSYQSIWFRIKVVMLLLAGLNVYIFHKTVHRRVDEWDTARVPPKAARVAGACSLALWAIIVVSGRMIAYNWFDCDKQPQAKVVNVLAGCVVPAGGSAMMNLLPVVDWIASSSLSHTISQSTWMFAVIESIHLLALSVIGGSVLIVDLRLLGLGLRSRTMEEVARDAQPWFIASWAVMIVTGLLLFVSEPQKLYYSTPFEVKMVCLLLATIFALTVRRKVTQASEGRVPPIVMKLVALVSLVLWFGVGAGGRWIGFSG